MGGGSPPYFFETILKELNFAFLVIRTFHNTSTISVVFHAYGAKTLLFTAAGAKVADVILFTAAGVKIADVILL